VDTEHGKFVDRRLAGEPRLRGGGRDRDEAEQDEEQTGHERHQRDHHSLAEGQDESHIHPLATGELRVHRPGLVRHRYRRRRSGPCGLSAVVPRVEVADLGHVDRQPADHESGADDEEEHHDGDIGRSVQLAGDLPHLGIDEQESDEQQQERERSGQQPSDCRNLIHQPTERPSGHRDEAIAGDDVHRRQHQDQAGRDHQPRPPLESEHECRGQRSHRHEAEFDESHLGRSFQQPASPAQVHHRHQRHQDAERSQCGGRVAAHAPALVQAVADAACEVDERHRAE
jgi:hypothetical protein